MRTVNPIDSLRQDLKYGVRQLRMKPGFALAAVVSLALGIGANTAFFTMVDQILLRLLPVHNPRELVQLRVEGGRFGSNSGDGQHTFSHPTYLALRDRNTVFSGLTGQLIEQASLIGEERSEMIGVALVAGNYFSVLGVRPYAGRLLMPEDDRQRNAHPVAVLQYDFWRNRFGGRPEMVGSTIRLNGSPFTVIGVAAPDFEGTNVGLPTHVWVPVMMKPTITPTWDELDNERYAWFYLFGRLKPGVTIDQAQAAMKVLYRQRQEEELKGEFFQKFPESRERFLRQNFTLIPAARGQSSLRFAFERPLIVLQWLVNERMLSFLSVGFALLATLLAVAGLHGVMSFVVARRTREIGIRIALGAERGHVIRLVLREMLAVIVFGIAAGVATGLLCGRFVESQLFGVKAADPPIFALSVAAVLTASLGAAFMPSWRASRLDPARALRHE